MADDRTGLDPAHELDAIVTALSHDLRAPLRAIDGFARILLAEEADDGLPEDTRRFLALVREASTELADLLDDLVEIAHVGRVPLAAREIDPAQLGRELIEAVLVPRAATGGRDVEWVVGAVPPCWGDPALLRRLLEELLDNALKFGAGRIELGWDAEAGAYFVADDGIGCDGALPEQAWSIFGRLHGRDAYPGTGAGLPIAARIAARHGGRVWASGRPGAGLTAWFTVRPR